MPVIWIYSASSAGQEIEGAVALIVVLLREMGLSTNAHFPFKAKIVSDFRLGGHRLYLFIATCRRGDHAFKHPSCDTGVGSSTPLGLGIGTKLVNGGGDPDFT